MTLQQLEYIVTLDKYGHFSLAADACGISQPTLSATIAKLEEELDTILFDRSKHPIVPTEIGQKVIDRAKIVLYEAAQLKETLRTSKEQAVGEVHFGIIPTVAPYVLPKLFRSLHTHNPGVRLLVTESKTASLIPALEKAELDMALMATPPYNPNLLAIPIYYEQFVAYVSPECNLSDSEKIDTNHLSDKHLWLLREEHCLSNQVLNLCKVGSDYAMVYRAGSIETLIKIVDENGGFTIIPELHVDLLTPQQKLNIRPFIDPCPVREISLLIRKDYVKEKLLNIMAENIRRLIPEHMIDERLKKYVIKL